ncbi:alpha-L-rhamnosidase [Actinomyces ruminicola]|uniref:Alpha-L-rhamnosidase n=1 Tax=Actinomyces ruminicola TaxID=332524 RepID=A0A1H0B7U7_9ACTO|nr:glycosyl hydrolase [Actinomyces ruminicola]SDN41728.1 alpha-L-rhamnosidase [Actinomyces ruminicola]
MSTPADLHRPATRASLTRARFATPEAADRPGIRWWWQQPTPVAELLEELRAIAAAGFGEVEIAFSPGFWADAAQREALGAVLEEARGLGVGVAMTLGAAWPLQTPNTARGTAHAAQELQYGVAWVEGDRRSAARAGTGRGAAESSAPADSLGGAITTPVPAPFDDPDRERGGKLIAVVAARVVQRGTPPRVVDSGNPWGKPTKIIEPERSTLLDETTLTVLTGAVRGEGASAVVTWRPGPGQWALMAFWSRDSEQGVTSFLDATAARAALGYLDEHQIGAAGAAALEAEDSTATELFEDSLELNADCLFWSRGFLERFRARRGYDPTRYLPLLMAHGQCRYWVPEAPPRPDFESADADGATTDLGRRVRADYDRTVTDLYVGDHLALIQDWAAGHGMRHKAQAAYGQNLEPVRSFRELVRCGGRAEVESLNSGDRVPMRMDHPNWRFSLDWQRSCVAGAHQGGAARVSTELGAQMDKCYDFSLADYRHMLDKEWAVGVTKPFVHGFAAQDPEAPWPTRGRFGTVVSESWNHRHFPQWQHWRGLTDYWARGTAVLETGTPRADVAVYRDGFLTTAARGNAEADATAPDRLIDAEPLERAGYNVQILDPVGLAEEGVVGPERDTDADGTVLFPDGPAYRALILDAALQGGTIPLDAARALARVAAAGLAIIFVGQPPAGDAGWGGADAGEAVREAITAVLTGARVKRVDGWEEVPAALAALGVRPRVAWAGPVLLSQVRDADEGRYVLVYNPAAVAVALPLEIEGTGRVEVLDLDAGTITPVGAEAAAGVTRVQVALEPLGLAVLRLVSPQPGPGTGEVAGAGGACAVAGAVVGASAGETGPAVGGRTGSGGEEIALTGWSLTVTSEEPDGPRTIVLPGQGPADWREVPALKDVSGTGVYHVRADVHGGADPAALADAVLRLGELGGSAVVRVGDREFGPVLRDDVDIPVGQALAAVVAAGQDPVIEIEVRTTLRNATLAADVYMKGPWAVQYPTVPHGLLGPVHLLS